MATYRQKLAKTEAVFWDGSDLAVVTPLVPEATANGDLLQVPVTNPDGTMQVPPGNYITRDPISGMYGSADKAGFEASWEEVA
jgi:hypothetical protein